MIPSTAASITCTFRLTSHVRKFSAITMKISESNASLFFCIFGTSFRHNPANLWQKTRLSRVQLPTRAILQHSLCFALMLLLGLRHPVIVCRQHSLNHPSQRNLRRYIPETGSATLIEPLYQRDKPTFVLDAGVRFLLELAPSPFDIVGYRLFTQIKPSKCRPQSIRSRHMTILLFRMFEGCGTIPSGTPPHWIEVVAILSTRAVK